MGAFRGSHMQPWDTMHSNRKEQAESKVDFDRLDKISKLTGKKKKKLLKKLPKNFLL